MNYSERFLTFLKKYRKQSAIADKLYRSVVIPNQNFGDWIDLNSKGIASYIPDRDLGQFSGSAWGTSRRVNMKPTRLASKVLKDLSINFVEADLIAYGDCVKAYASGEDQVLITKDIWYAYDGENYTREKSGTLGSSCMRHHKFQHAVNYYKELGLEVAYMTDGDGKIAARALIWRNVTIKGVRGKQTFLDRIYSGEAHYVSTMQKWASENGMYSKTTQSHSSQRSVRTPSGTDISATMSVYLKKKNRPHLNAETTRSYPYFDTFPYIHKKHLANESHIEVWAGKDGWKESEAVMTAQETDSRASRRTIGYGVYRDPLDPYGTKLGEACRECAESGRRLMHSHMVKTESGLDMARWLVLEINGKFYRKNEVRYSFIHQTFTPSALNQKVHFNSAMPGKEPVVAAMDVSIDHPDVEYSALYGAYIYKKACMWSESLGEYIKFDDVEVINDNMVLMKGRKMQEHEYRTAEGNPVDTITDMGHTSNGTISSTRDGDAIIRDRVSARRFRDIEQELDPEQIPDIFADF